MRKTTVAVIGAGVVGLSSAYSVKLFDENIDVTVFADKFSPDTTSNAAAGIFKFSEKRLKNTPKHLLRKWATSSYQWLKENCSKERALEMGISLSSGYLMSDQESLQYDTWLSIVDYKWLTAEQLKEFGPEMKSGVFATTFMCDCNRYLPWLLERLKEMNAKFIKKKIESFDELASFDIIINCCGIGAVELCNDDQMQPIRGQVARVKAPWIRHWYSLVSHNAQPRKIIYIYPNNDNLVVGGTEELSWDTKPSDKTHRNMFQEAEKLVPSLKHAEFLADKVGLRPVRTTVRLEKEDRMLKARPRDAPRKVKIVHNYGHGPCGVTLSWGCAQHAVELVAECIEELGSQQAISKL